MRVDRLLAIILFLSNKGKSTAKDLAEHFEVNIRTIYRDIDKLCEAGVPICAEGGKGGGYYLMDKYSVDNLYLGKDEMDSLLAIINNVQNVIGKNDYFHEIIERYKKQRNMEEETISIYMSHFNMEDDIKEYLYQINRAIKEKRLIEFIYINRRYEERKRTVEPVYISFSGGNWYINGFCRTRNDYRRFKFVRLHDLRVGEKYNGRAITMDELKQIFSKDYEENSIKVVLRFNCRAGNHLSEYFEKHHIKRNQDGSYDVHEYYPHDEGLIKYILSFGKDCVVLEPDYIKKEVAKYIDEMCSLYQE